MIKKQYLMAEWLDHPYHIHSVNTWKISGPWWLSGLEHLYFIHSANKW